MDDLLGIYKAIADHLSSVLGTYGADLVEGEIYEASSIAHVDGTIKPTAFFYIGTPGQGPRSGQGITTVANDLGIVTGSVLCVASVYSSCLSLVGLVGRTLNGFKPTSTTGEITCYGSAQSGPVNALMRPSRYAQTVGFGLSIGASSVVP